MPVTAAQKSAIDEVIRALTTATSRRAKRRLADMFLDLVDRQSWPEYYEVIPQPRCINGIKVNLSGNKYKNPLDAFEDLNLVFLNALYYNEEGSQIAKDASTLKSILESEWRQKTILPTPPTTPPASAAQKVHALKDQKERASAAVAPTAARSQPPPSKSQSRTSVSAPSPVHVEPTPPPPVPSSQTHLRDVKPIVKAKSPEMPASPEMEIDIGGTPEPEVASHDTARDGESEEIVRQLEKGLPRWEGFADVGWAEDITPDRMVDILVTLSKYRDESGNRPAVSLEAVPEETNIPDLSFNFPLSLRLIESRARMNYYESSKAFDKEMSQLFLKARRWYEPGTEPYGNILVLQRFYHALTSPTPPAPPYSSSTKFASLPAGPGTATPLHSTEGDTSTGVTTFRVSTKDRKILDEVHFKGWTIKLADWLHLSNPDDASRPIVGQVFRCYASEEAHKKGQLGVSVAWYFRPEQTFHPADRQFWEREVFKTSHFADHALEDVIEKIACQFTARHVRGRPRAPFWYPGWPLYMCDSRYNDRERVFVKIKNWNSCIPEEVRKKEEFMPIYPFERPVFPRHLPSPFLGQGPKLDAPGGILDTGGEKAEGEKEKGESTGAGVAVGTRTRTRPKRAAAAKSEAERAGVSKPNQASTSSTQPQAQAQHAQTHPQREGRSIIAAAGGLAALGSHATMEELPSETTRYFDRDPETNEVLWFAAPPVDIVHTPAPRHSLRYLAFLAQKRKRAQQPGHETVDVGDEQPDGPQRKRRKMPPTATETLAAVLKAHGLDRDSLSS